MSLKMSRGWVALLLGACSVSGIVKQRGGRGPAAQIDAGGGADAGFLDRCASNADCVDAGVCDLSTGLCVAAPCYPVTASATHASSAPSGSICVYARDIQAFTVTAASSFELSASSPLTVDADCPGGTWNNAVYQNGVLTKAVYSTGPITSPCTVHFLATSSTVAIPVAANAIDVTAGPYNADNKDSCATASQSQKTATTAALNASIAAVLEQNGETQGQQTPRYNHVVFIPAGTYCINGPIIYGTGAQPAICNVTLQGAGVGQTIITLDNALGFSEPVITTANCTPGDVDVASSGNVAFRNNINDLTINTGLGNPLAMGISFMGSNNAGVRNVSIVSGDGTGLVGFRADRFLEGPALVKNLSVSGFTTGVSVGGGFSYSMVFEHLQVTNQQPGGVGVNLAGRTTTVAIRDLESSQNVSTVQAISSADPDNMLMLIDSTLINTAGGGGIDAIANNGSFFVRNSKQTGYSAMIGGLPCTTECVSPAATMINGGVNTSSLDLPIEETPYYNEINGGTFSSWSDVTTGSFCGSGTGIHCATPNQIAIDSAPGINAALAAAAPGTTAFIKQGAYYLGPNETIEIPSNVVRLVCYGATFLPLGGTTFTLGTPTFRFNSASSKSLQTLEGCDQWVNYDVGTGDFFQNVGWTSLITNNSPGTVVLKDMDSFNYANTPQSYGGKVFMENVAGGPFDFVNETVYCRQCDPEPPGEVARIGVSGGLLWVLGWKQEASGTALYVSNGAVRASAEVLGAAIYSYTAYPYTYADGGIGSIGGNDDIAPLIVNDGAEVSIAGMVTLGRGGGDFGYDYDTWVQETQSGSCVGGCSLYASGSSRVPRAHGRVSNASSLMSLYIGY